jgi:putative nucleotidyltransferase with HDIG domain
MSQELRDHQVQRPWERTMHDIVLCSEWGRSWDDIRHVLERDFAIRALDFHETIAAGLPLYAIFDIDLRDETRLRLLKRLLANKPRGGKVVFVVEGGSHLEMIRANAIGATKVLHRPIVRQQLISALLGELGALNHEWNDDISKAKPGIIAGVEALQSVFSSVCAGAELDAKSIDKAGQQIVQDIGAQGLDDWVETVRKHHSQTYQHCLLVTGVAVEFGRHLGFSQADQTRLSVAGMLHDLGKAKIPLAILEKAGPLDREELAVMRQHPQIGAEVLAQSGDVKPEMLDIVLHHHEYLDGSGYPHGLKAREISDLVRLMTISDIFGALLERRSYKPPMSSADAYQVLLDMGPKLDVDMLREFAAVARSHSAHAPALS